MWAVQYHREIYCRIHCIFIEWYRLFEMVVNFKHRKQESVSEKKREKGYFCNGKEYTYTKTRPFHATCFSIDKEKKQHAYPYQHTHMHIINIYCIVYYRAIKSYQWNARYLWVSRFDWIGGILHYTLYTYIRRDDER